MGILDRLICYFLGHVECGERRHYTFCSRCGVILTRSGYRMRVGRTLGRTKWMKEMEEN